VGEFKIDWANYLYLLLFRFFFVRVFLFILFNRLRTERNLYLFIFELFSPHLSCREWLVIETTLVQL